MKALLSKSDGSDESIDLGNWGSRNLSKDELLWVDLESPDEDELKIVRGAIDLSGEAAEALESSLRTELMRPGFLTDLEEREMSALGHLTDRLERAGEGIAHVREMLIGTFDVHMTRTAQRTNDTMKILTLASVILLPSVVVAGIMG